LVLAFLYKNSILPKQLNLKHATPESHTVILTNDIWNFDRLVAIQVHQDYFLLHWDVYEYLGTGTLVINVYERYGVILFEAAEQLKLFPEIKIKHFE